MKHKTNSNCARTGRSLLQASLLALTVPLLAVGTGYGEQTRRRRYNHPRRCVAPHQVIRPGHGSGHIDRHSAPGRRGQDSLHPGNLEGISLRRLGADHLPSKYRAARRSLALEPRGLWSDAAHQSGYFTGSTELGEPIRHSAGYPLPHRGNTSGDGRSRAKYSRMTDGDSSTYWKSNPYLTSKFTGEDDSLHPQWVILDFGAPEKIDTLRIDWAILTPETTWCSTGPARKSLFQIRRQAPGSPWESIPTDMADWRH